LQCTVPAEFIAKLGVVVEEADESACWLELVDRCGMLRIGRSRADPARVNELRNIFAKSVGTARANARLAHVRQRDAN
jgi:hypothetical protein